MVVSDSGVELEVSEWKYSLCVECSEIWSIKCHIVSPNATVYVFPQCTARGDWTTFILYLNRSKSKSLQNYLSISKTMPLPPCRQACKASTPSLEHFPFSTRTETSSTDMATGVAPGPVSLRRPLIRWLDNINSVCPGDWIHLAIKMKCWRMEHHQAI